MTNTFYYFEGRIYRTEDEAIAATRNYHNKHYDNIETSKDWEEFEKKYYECKEENNSDFDAIEWAK